MMISTMISFFLLIGSNKKKFNFNTFNKPLNFILAIYNGKISLKEAEFKQRNLEEKIEGLQFNYKPKNEEVKEEINEVLMQANDLLEYRNKINAFKNIFLSEYLKKSDDTGYNYVLKDVADFIKEIESMSENINLSLLEDFFESSSPADYAKKLINTSPDENKKTVEEIQDRISNLKERIKKMSEKENKIKNADKTLEIIKRITDYNKDAQKSFQLASKVDKGK